MRQTAAVPIRAVAARRPSLADSVYRQLKDGIFEFRLLPDDRFSEGEVARCHREATERIRVLRHFDFTEPGRIAATYQEHAQILRRRTDQATMRLRVHVETSKKEVRKISLHKRFAARPSRDGAR